MPIKKEDAYRALELLEDYHSRLTRPQDRQLRGAIEKVIETFKSRLFQALIDIQEYYEVTLLDDQKSLQQKTTETDQVASRWDHPSTANSVIQPPKTYSQLEEPLPPPPSESNVVNDVYAVPKKAVRQVQPPASQPPPIAAKPQTAPKPQVAAKPSKGRQAETVEAPAAAAPQAANVDDADWEYEEITLEKGSTGLGFSIAGGTDSPHVGDDPSLYVTKIIDGGTAAVDGRMRANDIIVSVNGVSTVNVIHEASVDALKKAGKVVTLVLKRPRENVEQVMEIVLVKGNKGLGFSIAGGVGNEHVAGDTGIFITKVITGGAAEQDGRLQCGDRLIMVNDVNLENIDHDFAVGTLKATKQQVRLLIGRQSVSAVGGPQTTGASPTQVTREPAHDVRPAEAAAPPPTKPKGSKKRAKASAAATPSSPASDVRRVILKKGPSGLGFNIVGGEEEEGIFVSYILPGGPADVSGDLHKGDQLLSVKGIDLRAATHEQAAAALKGAGDTVEIMAQYKPNEFSQFEAKIQDLREQMMNTGGSGSLKVNQKRSIYVRALFDYDPAKDSGLPSRGIAFRYGDILHVTNAGDEEWWQAQRIMPPDDNVGIIPSKQRVEKKERARLKSIKFQAKPEKKKKKKGRPDEENERVLTYEVVEEKRLDYTRPVIILGPLKDRFNDDLMTETPEKFGSCIPHTTRPRRENEEDGRDYHFVPTREQMEQDIENHLFVEAGQFNNNLYGTSIQSVKEVAQQGRHCILDVSGNAIKRLHAAGIYPISVFIKAQSPEGLLDWDENLTEDQARKSYDKMLRIEEDFGDLFTAVVSGESGDDIYEQVKVVIEEQTGPSVWVPTNQPL